MRRVQTEAMRRAAVLATPLVMPSRAAHSTRPLFSGIATDSSPVPPPPPPSAPQPPKAAPAAKQAPAAPEPPKAAPAAKQAPAAPEPPKAAPAVKQAPAAPEPPKAAPAAKQAPAAPEPPKAAPAVKQAPAAPEPPKAAPAVKQAPAAPEPPKAAPAAKQAPAAPEPPKAAPAAKQAPAAPEPPKAAPAVKQAPAAPEPPKAAPAAKQAPAAPEPPKAAPDAKQAPAAPEPPKAAPAVKQAPAAPEPPKAAPAAKQAPAAPEPPKAAPAAKQAPAAPEPPKAAPAAKQAPAAPEPPKAAPAVKQAPAAPEPPKAAPAAKQAPAAPEPPKAAPDAKQAPAAPEPPKAAPAVKQAPAAPEPPKAAPAAKQAPAAPEPPKAAPAAKQAPAAPEPPKAAPAVKQAPAAPEPPKAAPAAKQAPAAPEPPKAAPAAKQAPAAPEPPKAAPAAKQAPAAPEPPKAAPAAKQAPAAPEPPKAAPAVKQAPAAPEPPKAAPAVKQAPAAPEPPKAAPAAKQAPAAPEPPKAAPAVKQAPAAPEPPKAAPAAKQAPAAPEPPKAAPDAKQAPAAPEPPKAAPAAKQAPAAPEPPKAAPAAKQAPAAPEPPKAAPAAKQAPAAPEPPKAAPAAKQAPAAPEPPKAAPAVKQAPAAPEPPKAAPDAKQAPAAPEPPKAAPAAKQAPAAPEPPKAAPAAKQAPAAPEPPKAAPAAKQAPAAPEPPKAAPAAKQAPAAPEPPKAAPAAKQAPAAPEPPKAAPAAKQAPAAPEPPKAAPAVKQAPAAPMRHAPQSGGRYQNVSGRRRGQAYHRQQQQESVAAAAAPRAPPPPRAPAHAPPPPAAPPAPPAAHRRPPPAPKTHTTIAPPSGGVATDAARAVEAALGRSTVSEVEAAAREAAAARPLRPSPEAEQARRAGMSVEWETVTGDEAGDADDVPVTDVSARHERLVSPSAEVLESLDRHEVPEEIGGAPPAGEAEPEAPAPEAAAEPSPRSTVVGTEKAVAVEVPARAVWGEGALDGSAAAAVKVTYRQQPSSVDGAVSLSLLLETEVAEPLALLHALHDALDLAEEMAASRTGAVAGGEAAPAQQTPALELATLPHCNFFVPQRSPLELSTTERRQYEEEKARLLTRLHSGTFVCSAVASNSVTDLGAEIFFACSQRRLLTGSAPGPAAAGTERAARPELEPEDADAAADRPASDGSSASCVVGFPGLRHGLFPAMHTLKFFRGSQGTQAALEIMPNLHLYDPASLEDVGLAAVLPAAHADDGADGAGREGDATGRSYVSWSTWAEEMLLSRLCRTPQSRLRLLEAVIFSRAFKAARRAASRDPLVARWYAYGAAAVAAMDGAGIGDTSTLGERHAAVCLPLVMALLDAAAGVHAAQTMRYVAGVRRRTYPALANAHFLSFKGREMDSWAERAAALAASPAATGATVLFDCSPRSIRPTLRFVEEHHSSTFSGFSNLNVILVGDEMAARLLIDTLPCATLVSSVACPWPAEAAAHGAAPVPALQQVRTFSRPSWPRDLQEDSLTAALTYLRAHSTPYVVCGAPAAQRLVRAVVLEAMRLCAVCDPAMVERAATEELQMALGPLQLADAYRVPSVLRMLDEAGIAESARGAGDAPPPALIAPLPYRAVDALQQMAQDGFIGAGGSRGGFYAYGGGSDGGGAVAGQLQRFVTEHYLRYDHMSPRVVADCLLAVALNTACALLSERAVLSTADVNLLSIAALGWRPSSGGVVAVAESRPGGLRGTVVNMVRLSERFGAHLAPHPLLLRLAEENVPFPKTL